MENFLLKLDPSEIRQFFYNNFFGFVGISPFHLATPLIGMPLCVDETIRLYTMEGDQMTPRHTLPQFVGTPLNAVLDAHRPAVLACDPTTNEVVMSSLERGMWTYWGILARAGDEQLTSNLPLNTSISKVWAWWPPIYSQYSIKNRTV